MKNIIILGGSYVGISTAHRILKQSANTGTVKVTLVSPNSHFYWNMASPRGLISGELVDDKLFLPTAAGFSQYKASQFEFILASAENLDIKAKKVELSSPAGNKTLEYDLLILATGSSTQGETPFKGLGSTEKTQYAIRNFQARVKEAKTIVLAGAGATGVELAGELGFKYGKQKDVILFASGPTILEGTPESVPKTAMKYLQDLKVKVTLQTKVINSTQMSNGQQELTLSGGDKIVADMYIPTFGVIPNSSYIPTEFLNSNGFVIVDENLNVKGAESVWAVGDISDTEPSQFIYGDRQSAHLAKNIVLVLSNKVQRPYKVATSRIMGVSIGKNGATGHFGSMRIPTFVLIRIRRNLFLEQMGPVINGSAF